MTLEELVSLNAFIGDLTVQIRKDGNELLQQYEIGAGARPDRYAGEMQKPRWETIEKPINARDEGKDYYSILTKRIPAELRRLTVHSWRNMGHGFRPGMNGNHNSIERVEVVVYPEGWQAPEDEEEKEQGGVEGQLCLW